MPRLPRQFVPGGIYHVYSRISSGENTLEGRNEAEELIGLIGEAKKRDGWTIFAWCVMSNHYHIVLQTGEVPLWRGLHRIQNLFSRRYNARSGRTGPLWQSRYQARLVGDERYLGEVILYVHLNPVRSGVAANASAFPYSGHLEILGKRCWDLVDVDQALLCFGETRKEAMRRYRAALAADLPPSSGSPDEVEAPRGMADDDPLWFPTDAPYVDALGRTTAPERHPVSSELFWENVCEVLDVDLSRVASRVRDTKTVEARWLAASLGVERWGLGSRQLARVVGKLPEVVSRWVARGTSRRGEDTAFRRAYEDLDRALQERLSHDGEREPPGS